MEQKRFQVVTAAELRAMSLAQVFMLVVEGTTWSWILDDKKVKDGIEFVSRVFKKRGVDHIPSAIEVPTAFVLTPWEDTLVVILGQDPYPNPGVPMGLAFSTRRGVAIQNSLDMMYRVYTKTLGYPRPTHGSLVCWALQGVLLLNTSLTTEPGKSNVHKDTWHDFSEPLIRCFSEKKPLVWILMGKEAQALKKEIKGTGHRFIETPHPVARDNSHLACNYYQQTNAILKETGRREIDWRIPE
jgi:uracil-DNA glycosylase